MNFSRHALFFNIKISWIFTTISLYLLFELSFMTSSLNEIILFVEEVIRVANWLKPLDVWSLNIIIMMVWIAYWYSLIELISDNFKAVCRTAKFMETDSSTVIGQIDYRNFVLLRLENLRANNSLHCCYIIWLKYNNVPVLIDSYVKIIDII